MTFAEELVSFVYCDLAGIVRGRSVPAEDAPARMATGVGWVPANQSLTPFGGIADPNPFGSVGDLRLLPDPITEARVDLWEDASPLHLVLCSAVETDGSDWDCCPRTFLARTAEDFERETGLRPVVAFEHEFQLVSGEPSPPPFSLRAQRRVEPFGPLVVAALRQAGLRVETFLPEYGPHQFEVSLRPREALAAADESVVLKELVREVALRERHRATFTPLAAPGAVGNGVHIHLSLLDESGRPAAYDPARAGRLSEPAGRFAAGILAHLPALLALTAPSAISYERLRPHRWSTGFAGLGERNREAALRIAPVVDFGGADPASAFNLEYRPADATACPHLALGVILRAGLEGIRGELDPAPVLSLDPAELSEADRRALALPEIPASLEEALGALENDEVVRSWFSKRLVECYLGVKRAELAVVEDLSEAEAFAAYAEVY